MVCLTTWLIPLWVLLIQTAFACNNPPPSPQPPEGSCQCGIKYGLTSKIVGGQPADKNVYPWMVALVMRGDREPFCGGSLITMKHVLTAAHCTRGQTTRSIQVLLGLHRTDQNDFEEHDVSNIVRHEFFHNQFTYDYAILTIDSTIRSSWMPVCLPADTSTQYVGRKATIPGWGLLSTDGPKSKILREVDLIVTKDKECNAIHKNISNTTLDSSHMCAIAPGKGFCRGDSGGPLMLEENGRWTVVGVASFYNTKCANPGVPDVFARVTEVMDWIRKNTNGAYSSDCQMV